MPEENVTLTCKHSIKDYNTILWYQKTRKDENLELIGYVYYSKSEYEKRFEGKFTLSGEGCFFCNEVHQSPADVLCLPDENVTLTCKHNINNYDTILWYKRTYGDTNLQLIAYAYYENPKYEKNEDNFTLIGDGRSSVSLQISKARHSALYSCAAYYTQCYTRPLFKTKTLIKSTHLFNHKL
ncbi:hypothetical protein C0J45_7947 [Silurus meridionalis]|nr:hypothetical protein C0J45_7947 [Silurus meridionalis]